MPEVILLSQTPLPYSKIGSWSALYKNYLSQDHLIDYIVCEQPDYYFDKCKYLIIKKNKIKNLFKKITNSRFLEYQIEIKKIINPDKKYIIQIIDNFGLAVSILNYLNKNNLRKQCYIQFFYHGLESYDNDDSIFFYDNLDELILLTNLSHENLKLKIKTIIPKISILQNGIDNSIFFKLDNTKLIELKNQFGYNDLKVFLWCSQDRPKKGLHIALEAFKKIHDDNSKTILLVIGCEPRKSQNGVEFLGKILNAELPQYYQIADVYLFPTLWQEGFGMSLIEALHCGCYCIASAMGGVPEVLEFGKLGVLVNNPNNVEDWVLEMQSYIDNNIQEFEFPKNIYTSINWNIGMNKIIENAKNYFV